MYETHWNSMSLTYMDGVTEQGELTDLSLREELPYIMKCDSVIRVIINGETLKDTTGSGATLKEK